MTKLYKTLLVTSFLLYVIWYLMPYFWYSLYDKNTIDALSWSGYGGIISNYNVLAAYTSLLIYAVTTIGLFRYKLWARLVFVIITVASLTITLITGLEVQTAFESTLHSIIDLMDGAIITLIYLTSIRHKFNK